MMSPVAELAVEISREMVIVHLTISNAAGNKDLRVERRKILASPPLESNFFQITCDGKSVRYIGPMAKMKAPGPEDFLQVRPGGRVKGTAEIGSRYAFLPGRHQYTITYTSFFDSPEDNTRLIKVISNVATFVLTKGG